MKRSKIALAITLSISALFLQHVMTMMMTYTGIDTNKAMFRK